MSVIFFAKVNYDNIYEVYNKKRELREINNKGFSFLTEKIFYEKIESKKDEEGNILNKEIKYEFLSLEKEDNIIIGNIIKNDYVYLKKIDRKTTQETRRKEETDESILFYYDVNREIIAFHTTRKFGHIEFSEAFENLLNNTFKKEKQTERFSVGIKNNISSLSKIIKDIKELGVVKELKIDIIPPNWQSTALENMERDSKEGLRKMQEANVTRKSTIFTSNSKEGINIDASIISSNIGEFKLLHKDLDEKDVINNTYGEIVAVSKEGKKYSTKTSDPLKYEIDDKQKSIKGFKEIMGKIIDIILMK